MNINMNKGDNFKSNHSRNGEAKSNNAKSSTKAAESHSAYRYNMAPFDSSSVRLGKNTGIKMRNVQSNHS